jgi:hypothetical protein
MIELRNLFDDVHCRVNYYWKKRGFYLKYREGLHVEANNGEEPRIKLKYLVHVG